MPRRAEVDDDVIFGIASFFPNADAKMADLPTAVVVENIDGEKVVILANQKPLAHADSPPIEKQRIAPKFCPGDERRAAFGKRVSIEFDELGDGIFVKIIVPKIAQ